MAANNGVAISTAGITFGYAVETTKDTRPTSGYKLIPDIKEIPDFNPEPDSMETTTLAETEYKTYIKGLKDVGGALPFTANFTQKLQDEWKTLVTAYDTAKASGLRVWFEIQIPDLTESVFFHGEPSKMGLPAATVNSVLETSVYVTPTGAPDWYAKSTTTV